MLCSLLLLLLFLFFFSFDFFHHEEHQNMRGEEFGKIWKGKRECVCACVCRNVNMRLMRMNSFFFRAGRQAASLFNSESATPQSRFVFFFSLISPKSIFIFDKKGQRLPTQALVLFPRSSHSVSFLLSPIPSPSLTSLKQNNHDDANAYSKTFLLSLSSSAHWCFSGRRFVIAAAGKKVMCRWKNNITTYNKLTTSVEESLVTWEA